MTDATEEAVLPVVMTPAPTTEVIIAQPPAPDLPFWQSFLNQYGLSIFLGLMFAVVMIAREIGEVKRWVGGLNAFMQTPLGQIVAEPVLELAEDGVTALGRAAESTSTEADDDMVRDMQVWLASMQQQLKQPDIKVSPDDTETG